MAQQGLDERGTDSAAMPTLKEVAARLRAEAAEEQGVLHQQGYDDGREWALCDGSLRELRRLRKYGVDALDDDHGEPVLGAAGWLEEMAERHEADDWWDGSIVDSDSYRRGFVAGAVRVLADTESLL